uniref:Mediator of RNA polymerase II transcription subunit 1 n=1 Tax=Iconisemion striatum TaxID=60296 RepID=A0A1A7WSG2_9TELE
MVDGVPFTQLAHIPPLLELLRHQCAINTLLRSCTSGQSSSPGVMGDLHYEVLPESTASFSVTFHRPHADSLAVLLVSVSNPRKIICKLFGAGISDPSLNENISTVMNSCMSIPVTMTTLYSRLEEICSASFSPSFSATTEVEMDRSSPAMDISTESPMLVQGTAVPEDSVCVCDSAKSELLSGINSSAPDNT